MISATRLAGDRLLNLSHQLASGGGGRPRREGAAAVACATRFERATPSASAIVSTACPAPATAREIVVFWLRQIERVALDLVLQDLLTKQPLQLTNLLLQRSVLGGRRHFITGHTADSAPSI
jgi:hypothetical protein